MSKKKARNILRNRKRGQRKGNKISGDNIRKSKYATIKQMNAWRVVDKDWEYRISVNLDKFVNEIAKGHDLSEEEVAHLTSDILTRIKLYQEVAELTGVPLTRGEALWAIQREYIYQRNLYKQDLTTEESLRDMTVHNLKYVIEQTYSRNNEPPYEELKKKTYNEADITLLKEESTRVGLSKRLTEYLQKEVNKLNKEDF